jgi:RimJ/RimL family protein N-acetyltransferase
VNPKPHTFDLQPHLIGQLVELRPLQPDNWNDLFRVASDPLIWEQHPASDRHKEDVFRVFFSEALQSGGAFAVIDRSNGEIIGSTRFNGYGPLNSEIEIGWTFLSRKYWGGQYNGEMKRLLLAHAFQFVERVAFYVGENNIRSQKAMEKIGGVRDSIVERGAPGPVVRSIKFVISKSS